MTPRSPRFILIPLCIPLLACLIVVGCIAMGGGTMGVLLPVPLSAEHPDQRRVGTLEYRGGLELRGDNPDLGGLSAIRVLEGGRRFIAVSDIGRVVTGILRYDASGNLAGAGDLVVAPLLDEDGQAVTGRRRRDAEGLAQLPDGHWVVSFERDHRLEQYAAGLGRTDARPPTPLPLPPGLSEAGGNGGAETVAAFSDGRLLVIQEDGGPDHPGWLGQGTDWMRFRYRTAAGFHPTDAAVLPSGDVLVLERRVSWVGGFTARVVRVARASLRKNAIVAGQEVARLEPPLSVDNMEGIAVVPGRDGQVMVYLVSDNNFTVLQRTLLLMFAYQDEGMDEKDRHRP